MREKIERIYKPESLNGGEILFFEHFDGFTNSLLHMELIVDEQYVFKMFVKSFEQTVSYTDEAFSFYLEGQLPDALQKDLFPLVSHPALNLSKDYSDAHPGMSGLGSQRYTLRDQEQVYMINIDIDTTGQESLFPSQPEQRFLRFCRALDHWIRGVYAKMKD
ncbi:MAG: hypothetical protein AB8F95_10055 [Bacteroidia bacterium]